ncbi:MAG: hypothetical protein JW881_00335 [Spirochaetales bacterium]|nr:hypothetical protein [Spirochaetales bacterium]
MNKKLTLSLDDKIIEKAKQYASNKNESLSEVVENYFRLITSGDKEIEDDISPTVRELLGSVHVPDDFDFKKAKYEYLKEKYLDDKTIH